MIENLHAIDEDKMEECNAAYDRAKMQQKMSEFREKKSPPSFSGAKQRENLSKLLLKINADALRLSHILEVKRLFRSHSGSTPVEIIFYANELKKGTLRIDSTWGIQWNQQLEEGLKSLPGIELINVGE
jgi:hypothetical protein